MRKIHWQAKPPVYVMVKKFFAWPLKVNTEPPCVSMRVDAMGSMGLSNDTSVVPSLRDNAFPYRVENQFGEAMKIKLILQIPAVCLDRVCTKVQSPCDLFIRLAFG